MFTQYTQEILCQIWGFYCNFFGWKWKKYGFPSQVLTEFLPGSRDFCHDFGQICYKSYNTQFDMHCSLDWDTVLKKGITRWLITWDGINGNVGWSVCWVVDEQTRAQFYDKVMSHWLWTLVKTHSRASSNIIHILGVHVAHAWTQGSPSEPQKEQKGPKTPSKTTHLPWLLW